MGKDKLKRFEENKTFPNLYEPSYAEVYKKDYLLKGHWSQKVFGNDHPIVLELGCGKGEYTWPLPGITKSVILLVLILKEPGCGAVQKRP